MSVSLWVSLNKVRHWMAQCKGSLAASPATNLPGCQELADAVRADGDRSRAVSSGAAESRASPLVGGGADDECRGCRQYRPAGATTAQRVASVPIPLTREEPTAARKDTEVGLADLYRVAEISRASQTPGSDPRPVVPLIHPRTTRRGSLGSRPRCRAARRGRRPPRSCPGRHRQNARGAFSRSRWI